MKEIDAVISLDFSDPDRSTDIIEELCEEILKTPEETVTGLKLLTFTKSVTVMVLASMKLPDEKSILCYQGRFNTLVMKATSTGTSGGLVITEKSRYIIGSLMKADFIAGFSDSAGLAAAAAEVGRRIQAGRSMRAEANRR